MKEALGEVATSTARLCVCVGFLGLCYVSALVALARGELSWRMGGGR